MKSLLDKLGFKPGMTGWIRDRPAAFDATLNLPDTIPDGPADLILSFVTRQDQIAVALDSAMPYYARGGRLWFAYPKKSGSVASDITRDHGWTALGDAGLLAVTQIALDDDWSALRFRYRDEIARLTRRGEAGQAHAA